MSLADKLLELNDVKQDIKTAIEGKGVDMTGVPFTGYPTKIDSITVGTGMSYHDYAKNLYTMWGYETQFTEAWTESQNSLEVLFEIPLSLAASNTGLIGKVLDLYVGTDSTLTDFYNLVVSGEFEEEYSDSRAIIINKSVIPNKIKITEGQYGTEDLFEIPLMLAAANQNLGGLDLDLYAGTDSALTNFYNLVASGEFPENSKIIVNNSVMSYQGDLSSVVGLPFPVYAFAVPDGNPAGMEILFIADMTPLDMGLGIALGTLTGVVIPDNIVTIRTGTPFPVYAFGGLNNYTSSIDNFILADLTPFGVGLGVVLGKIPGTVLPDNILTIRRGFENYEAGLIIPEMIESVGDNAFYRFNYVNYNTKMRVPYIIGLNVKYIGRGAFSGLEYRLPLIIPDSVEWIGTLAFDTHYSMRNIAVVPRNVTHLGLSAFGYGGSEDFAIVYPEIPPVLMDYDFDFGPLPMDIARIYVPDDAVNAYKSAWTAEGALEEYPDKIRAISSLPYHEMLEDE